MVKRNKVSDEVLKQMICELLDTGERGATNFYELLRTKVQISKERCLKMYPLIESEWVNFKDKVINEQRGADITEAARIGLKTDLELEVFLCQLAMGDLKMEEIVSGVGVLRDISPMERIRATEQIFKKRGSYAPTKVANTNKDGEDIVTPFTNIQVLEIINSLRENSSV